MVAQRIVGYGVGTVAVSIMTGLLVALGHFVSIPNVSLLYLPPILITAVYFGLGASLVASTLAVAEYDFFLLRPLYTLGIGHLEDLLAFITFLLVAVLTSQLAARARGRVEAAQRRAAETTTLYELGLSLMSAETVADVLPVITERVVDVFDVDLCAIFVPTADGNLDLAAETVRGGTRDRREEAAVRWAYRQGTEVALPGAGDANARRMYVPLKTSNHIVGVMEVGASRRRSGLDPAERRLITSFAAQAALVIGRAQADEERRRLTVLEESDRLKTSLISAVSHDLRTPLASIKAAATALLLTDASWSAQEGREVLRTIDHEADRLNRLVGNLLDLSRIEGGVLRPDLDWYDVGEAISMALPRLRRITGDRQLEVQVQPDIPMARFDLLRIEELIANLVENAVKYSPSGTPVEICAQVEDEELAIGVADHGPGIPDHRKQRIFDTFYRGGSHTDRDPGSGLGLAICRGIAEAHGGRIEVRATPGGGATFVLKLPRSSFEDGGTP